MRPIVTNALFDAINKDRRVNGIGAAASEKFEGYSVFFDKVGNSDGSKRILIKNNEMTVYTSITKRKNIDSADVFESGHVFSKMGVYELIYTVNYSQIKYVEKIDSEIKSEIQSFMTN